MSNHDAKDAALSLTDRARIRGASRMIPDGTDAAKVTPEQIQQVAADVESLCRKHNIKRREVAKAIGYSEGTLTDFVNLKYKGNAGQLAIDLDAWVDEEDQRQSRPKTTQFVWTNAAMEIRSVADFAIDYRKIGLVYSPDSSGMGKTTAAKAVQEVYGARRCSMLTIDKASANATGLTRKLCEALAIDNKGSNEERFNRIVRALKGRSHLLIIDQIHNLRHSKDDKPFYYLTDLYDATETAQLWLGTADLLTYFNRQRQRSADESLAQIKSRISPCVDLLAVLGNDGGEPLYTVEQVREMFARNRLKLTPTAARFLCTLGNLADGGGLRICVQLVEYVTAVAEARKWASIDLPQLKSAMRFALPSDRAAELLSRVEQQASHASGPRAAVG